MFKTLIFIDKLKEPKITFLIKIFTLQRGAKDYKISDVKNKLTAQWKKGGGKIKQQYTKQIMQTYKKYNTILTDKYAVISGAPKK